MVRCQGAAPAPTREENGHREWHPVGFLANLAASFLGAELGSFSFRLNTLLLLFADSWGQAPQSGVGSWGSSFSQAPPKPVGVAASDCKTSRSKC